MASDEAARRAATAALAFLRPDQKVIAAHQARIKVLSMGRRWGKTVLGGTMAVTNAYLGGSVAWIVPTYRNARPVWRFVERATAPVANQLRVHRGDRIVEFPGGGWIGVYTADSPTAIRGEAFDFVAVDEAARVPEEVWTDVIEPTLADRAGKALLISTPKGRNWFYRQWARGWETDNEAEYKSWKAPTAHNPNPHVRAAAERARLERPAATYQQEWLAEFIEEEGLVFRRVEEAIRRGVDRRVETSFPLSDGAYVFGVDWGRSIDSTVIAVVDIKRRALVHLDRFTETGFEAQAGRLRALYGRFRPAVVLAEYNSIGGPIVERLQAEGMPVRAWHATNATKAVIIEQLALSLESDAIDLLDNRFLTEEMKAMESKVLPSGMIRYAAPEGMHDDTVIALALAWAAAAQPRWEVL